MPVIHAWDWDRMTLQRLNCTITFVYCLESLQVQRPIGRAFASRSALREEIQISGSEL